MVVREKWPKQKAKMQRKYEGKKPKECGNTKIFMLEREEKKKRWKNTKEWTQGTEEGDVAGIQVQDARENKKRVFVVYGSSRK